MIRGALLILFATATAVQAQRPFDPDAAPPPLVKIRPIDPRQPPKYVRFNFDGNPEQMLAEFLKTKTGQDLFQKLLQGEWQKLLETPSANIEDILRQKADANPFLRELVEKFMNDNPKVRSGNPVDLREAAEKFGEQIKDNKDLVDMLLKNIQAKTGPDGLPDLKNLIPPAPPGAAPGISLKDLPEMSDDDFSLEDRFGEWLVEALKDSRLRDDIAEFLKETPELADAIGDFMKSLGDNFDGSWLPRNIDVDGGKWKFDLKPPKLPFEMGKLPKLPTFKMPTLPRLNLPKLPRLGRVNFPNLPSFGAAPRMPNAPDAPGRSFWLYLGVAIVVGMWIWWLIRNRNGFGRSPENAVATLLASLPTTILTRSELRNAFDALTLAKFGDKARPWNHRHIASHLAEAPASADAAVALANLYEMARYTPGDDRLSDAERQIVKKSLAVLTQAPG